MIAEILDNENFIISPVIRIRDSESISKDNEKSLSNTYINKNNKELENERSLWKLNQEKYKQLLLEGNVKSIKCNIYDFTKGSENQQRLINNNYEFVVSKVITEKSCNKDDLRALYNEINNNEEKTMGIEKNVIQPIENRESAINIEDLDIPLLIDEEEFTMDFLCFRNVNRDIVNLIGCFVFIGIIMGFLYFLSTF